MKNKNMMMNYDKVADAIYFRVRRGKINRTMEVNDQFIVDLNKKGKILGVEILNFSSSKKDVKMLEENAKNGIPFNIITGTPALA